MRMEYLPITTRRPGRIDRRGPRLDHSAVAPPAGGSGHRVSARRRWLVSCSCGWSRECISQWAAQTVAKLHPRLSESGAGHTITIEEPRADAPPGTQLPLV